MARTKNTKASAAAAKKTPARRAVKAPARRAAPAKIRQRRGAPGDMPPQVSPKPQESMNQAMIRSMWERHDCRLAQISTRDKVKLNITFLKIIDEYFTQKQDQQQQ